MAKIVVVCIIVPDSEAKTAESEMVKEALPYGFVTSNIMDDTDQNRRKIYDL